MRTPDFEAIANKRMSELTAEEQADAHEYWIRNQIGWFSPDTQRHLLLLIGIIDAGRKEHEPKCFLPAVPAESTGQKGDPEYEQFVSRVRSALRFSLNVADYTRACILFGL